MKAETVRFFRRVYGVAGWKTYLRDVEVSLHFLRFLHKIEKR